MQGGGTGGVHDRVKWPGLTLLSPGTMEPTSRYWEEEEKKEMVKHGGFSSLQTGSLRMLV